MQPDIDAQLSNFFEDAPLPDFARVMRGYDPHQVNEHLKLKESEVRKHQENAQALQQELADAHRQMQEIEQPTLSGLGSRIEQLFRLAEEQAAEHIAEARSAAHDLTAAAKVEAAEARASSASSSTMGHTTTPRATRASSRMGNWDHRVGSIPAPVL